MRALRVDPVLRSRAAPVRIAAVVLGGSGVLALSIVGWSLFGVWPALVVASLAVPAYLIAR